MSVIGHPSSAVRPGRPDRAAPDGLAAALVGLGSLGILGSAVQLTAPGSAHVLPWAATALLGVAAVLLVLPRVGRPGRHAARAMSLVVLVSAATAVAEHLSAAPGAGVGVFTHSWYSGGAAPLAPGLLGQSALLLLLASLRAGTRLGRLGRWVCARVRRTAGPR